MVRDSGNPITTEPLMPIRQKSRRKKRPPLSFVATCGAGLEQLVAGEIGEFGGRDVRTTPGAVAWHGNLESGYRACLWSRFASRILLELATFEAPDPDTLYRNAGTIDWDDHFDADTTFAVYCTLAEARLSHSHYASLRIKDAIVDQFRRRTGRRPNIDVHRPGIRLNLHVRGTRATMALDLSGDSLHRRGYRTGGGEAPLKETLAAAIVHLAGVRGAGALPADAFLLDPMCGSGTLLIEAALILGDSAPGLQRKTFGFMFWKRHNKGLWQHLVGEALEREEEGMARDWPTIIGYDADPHMVAVARRNIENAGLDDRIIVHQRQLARLESPGRNGLLLTNPPYGERLSEKESVRFLYRFLGRRFRERFAGWRLGFFTANPDLADMLGLAWQERFRLYNGPLKCRLLTATAPPALPAGPAFSWQLHSHDLEGPAADFANRLRKNCQARFAWAQEHEIQCFRIYDADMPEFNMAIDLYEQWVHVQEYAPPASVDPARARERFAMALQVIRTLLGVPHSHIFIKTRQRQKGRQQYQKKEKKARGKETREPRSRLREVREGGLVFLVNFTDYLDTGLFLDHRTTRQMIRGLAEGRKFLNLFAYTGTATVHAAAGGAQATTSVDQSATYLARARANLARNGFGGPRHQTIQDDCINWLRNNRERYGLIFVDPPTFSNSKHKKRVFDIQRDHVLLLHLAMQRLSRSGTLLFSTNFRKFALADELGHDFDLREITDQTIPEDFRGSRKIHRCWRIRHRDRNSEAGSSNGSI